MGSRTDKKGPHSSRRETAGGFAKRHSRKAKTTSTASADVYEYSSGKNRRSAITLSLDKDEAIGLGPDEDANTEFDYGTLRAQIMNTGEDGDAVIKSDDDEEIESDDAFEESDVDRFAGFSFIKPSSKTRGVGRHASGSRKPVRPAEIDLNEDGREAPFGHALQEDMDDEEGEGNDDDFLDVLDVLDGRGEPDLGEEEVEEQSEEEEEPRDAVANDEVVVEAAEKDDDNGEMKDVFASSDVEDKTDEDALDNLEDFVSKLETGKKRKAGDEDEELAVSGGHVPTHKRRMLKERTEAGVEGEFGVRASSSGSKLQLDDLLAPLTSTSSSLQALRKSTKPLIKGGALPAPLPLRTQDRLDREAAYEQTKTEVDKWTATMKRIKEAEHLSFPLQVPQKVNASNSELAAKFKPTTELESAVDKLLRAAQMRDETDITKTEELKMNHLTVEEVAERRAELRKMRELMFRAETKAKRVAKIKSKTYRKIQRKSRDKVKSLLKEAEGEDGNEHDEEERMQHEVERAKERATLRHKNTGKWAKAMKGRGELEVDQRRDIEEMLEQGERLRAKIQGDHESEDEDENDADDGIDGIKASAFDELQRLGHDEDTEASPAKAKGVFAMKFMQDAMAREARRVGEAVDDFRDEIAQMGGSDEDAANGEDPVVGHSGIQVQRVGGRMVFRPGQTVATSWPVAPSDSSSTLKSSEPALKSPVMASQATDRSSPRIHLDDSAREPSLSPEVPIANADPNPWLQPPRSSVKQSRRKNEVLVGKDSASADKSKNQMKRHQKKGEEERAKARDDAIVEISMDDVLKLPNESSAQQGQASKAKSAKTKSKEKAPLSGQQVDAAYEDSDTNSEIEAQEEQQSKSKSKGQGVRAFEQRDLVALAFAGDDVVQDFEKLKKREIDADAPREEDHTLPGWGSWGGAGTRRNPHATKFIKKIAGVDPASRADHGKPHLIISEKKDKKAAKYLTKDLPYPYTSKAQFERSMEVPIGTEWNTRVGFQRQTLPRVVKKMGTVIDPLEKLF